MFRQRRKGHLDEHLLTAEIQEDNLKMDVDQPVVPRVRDLDINFVDDELQAALAHSHKANTIGIREQTENRWKLMESWMLSRIINIVYHDGFSRN
jgi:hypothetical protein